MAKVPLHITASKLDSAVLGKIAAEVGKVGVGTTAAFDEYVKTANCSLHGKGDHIKGDGPNNYLKTSDPGDFSQIENVLQNYEKLVSRLATDVAAKIQGVAGGIAARGGGGG